jgi:hypothetical protein
MSDKNKELKQKYKQMKPDMGVYIIRNAADKKCLVESAKDLKSAMNSAKFKLDSAMHPNRELQKAWTECGGAGFTIEALDHLDYAKDGIEKDYTDDLAELWKIWMDKLASETGVKFF